MALTDMRDVVTKNLGDRTTESTFVDKAINRVVREINRMVRIKEMETTGTFSTVDGTAKYTLDTNLITGLDAYSVLWCRNNESDQQKLLARKSYKNYLDVDRSTDLEGVPTEYAFWGDSLYLFNKIPDAVYTIEIAWHKRHASLDEDSDTLEFPEEWEEVVEVGATARMFRLLNEPDLYQLNQGEYQRLLSLWQSPRAEEDVEDPTLPTEYPS